MKMQSLGIEITWGCNEKCLHCYLPKIINSFIPIDLALSVMKQARSLGANTLLLSGGEAFLHPELNDILLAAEEIGFRVDLFTNGSLLTEKHIPLLKKISLHTIQFSLYSMDSAIHDRITGLNGSWKRTMSAISLSRKADLPVFIAVSVMKSNYLQALDVIAWANREGLQNCPNFTVFTGLGDRSANRIEQLGSAELYWLFERTMRNNGELAYVWGEKYGISQISRPYVSLEYSIAVGANGFMYPSFGWREILGDLRKVSLASIWYEHPLLNELRKIQLIDMPACRDCDIRCYCDFCPIDHVNETNGDYYTPNPQYCEYIRIKASFIKKRDVLLGKIL